MLPNVVDVGPLRRKQYPKAALSQPPGSAIRLCRRHREGNLALLDFTVARLGALLLALLAPVVAHATLTVTPITFNVVGLDSNTPASGPKFFPVGARVCSNVATTNVTATWVWDSANANINLRTGSLSSIFFPAIAAGAAGCRDAYFEVEVTQVAAAFDTARRYHIVATDGSGSFSTPTPREVYVEHLISQSRNAVTGVRLNGVPIPPGGTVALVLGNTYTIELDSGTATQGYNQFESFINFSNAIFQIQSVVSAYSADNSPYVPGPAPITSDKLYADACLWENNPASPNYRSCVGGDFKAGGSTITTTYVVKIIGGGGTAQTLSTLLYDFSGSSYHYNADFSVTSFVADIVDPTVAYLRQGVLAGAGGGRGHLDPHLHHRQSQCGRHRWRQFHRYAPVAFGQSDGRGNASGLFDVGLRRGDVCPGGGRVVGLLFQRHRRRQQHLYGQRSRGPAGATHKRHLCQRFRQSFCRHAGYG